MSLSSLQNDIRTKIKDITSNAAIERSHCEYRRCSRCQLPLTDPASWERGQGPLCAKKDTTLFAKTIAANYALLMAYAVNITTEGFDPIVAPVWELLFSLIQVKTESALQHSMDAGNTGFQHSGEDTRFIAKTIDWLLSYNINAATKENLIGCVRSLGFIGLAGVLNGQSSTGISKLAFDEVSGLLTLEGASNKAGFQAMRKIPGIQTPKYRGDKSPYVCKAVHYEAFLNNAMTFWPCFSEDTTELTNKVKAWLAARPKETVSVVSKKSNGPQARIKLNGNLGFSLSFDWIGNQTYKVVDALKTGIGWKRRRYDPETKTWTFLAKSDLDTVHRIMSVDYEVVVESNNA